MTHSVSLVLLSAIRVPTVGMATPIRISAGRIVRRDLERRLAVRLLGDRLATVAEAPHDEADGGEHDEPDDAGDDEHRVLEVLDLLGVRSGGLPRVLRGVVGAAGDGERAGRGARDRRGASQICPGGSRS